jgi:hypothetical protein
MVKSARMKKADLKCIGVTPQTHELLAKAAEGDPMRPTLGQMVTKLAYEKYGHLAVNHSEKETASGGGLGK